MPTEYIDEDVTSHSVPLSGLTPDTQYRYRVRSTDPSNNTSAFSDWATFTTGSAAGSGTPADLAHGHALDQVTGTATDPTAETTFDNATGHVPSATTGSFNFTIGGGNNRFLLVAANMEANPGPAGVFTSLTFDGVELTSVPAATVTAGTAPLNTGSLWYIPEADLPVAGTYSIAYTLDSLGSGGVITAISFADADQAAPSAVATDTALSSDVVSSQVSATDGAMVVDFAGSGDTRTFTQGTDQTQRDETSDLTATATLSISTKPVTADGTITMTQTAASSVNRLIHIAASIEPATVGGGGGGGTTADIVDTDWSNVPIGAFGADNDDVALAFPSSPDYTLWGHYPSGISGGASVVSDSSGPSDADRVLQIVVPAGEYTGVTKQFKLGFPVEHDELWLQYDIKFGDASNPFVFENKGGKMPGLGGNPNPTSDTMVSCGDPSGTNGFSARLMWRNLKGEWDLGGGDWTDQERLLNYLYDMDKTESCGREGSEVWSSAVGLNSNQWYTVTQRVIMNTPGVADGSSTIWQDGVQVNHLGSLRFRASGETWGVNQLIFHSYFGGADTSWTHAADAYIFYDRFRVGTSSLL